MLPICLFLTIVSLETSFCQSEFTLSGQSAGKSSCRTVGGPSPGKSCQFPFTFAGVTRSSCISDQDPDGKLWCSTKVDKSGVHVGGGGHWGYCPDNCLLVQDNQIQFSQNFVASSSLCVTAEGKSGQCLPPSVCVGVQHDRIDQDSCSLESGHKGLCCTQHLKNKIINLGSDDGSLPKVSVPSISFNELDTIFEEVNKEVSSQEASVISIRVNTRNRLPGPRSKTPSFFHKKFNSPRKEIVNFDKDAQKLLTVTKRLKDLKNLTDTQVSVGLRSGFNRFTSQSINRLCPWNNPLPVCDKNSQFRTYDGTCNNLKNPNYGRTGTPFQRILLPEYARGTVDLPRKRQGDGRELPAARDISNLMASGSNNADNSNTLLVMQMGQFIDHDLTHTPNYSDEEECCRSDGKFPGSFSSEKCFPIRISRNDPFWRGVKTCMEFARSLSSPGLNCELQNREQTNQITHWLDGSNIYGSDREEALSLRSGFGGQLKVSRSSRTSRDDLPTCNRPGSGDIKACETCEGDDDDCYFAGDFRVNEQINLVVVHTLFMREHNRIASEFKRHHPDWDDERLFQEARKVNVAEYQHIVYNEWLPVILGNNFMRLFGLFPLSSGHSFDYDDNFDPRINNEFAAAAFRFGHSLVPKTFLSIEKGRTPKVMNLKEVFFQPKEMKKPGFFDGLLRGLIDEKAKAADSDFVDEIRNHLFEKSDKSGGLDLVALNIQRGRDHGLPGYNKYREICLGSKATQWSDFRKTMSPVHVEHLQRMYRSVDDVDLFVGGFLEQPHQDSLIGPVFKCIIGDQFARLKKGDRFFYDLGVHANTRFSQQELDEVRKASLARLICDNSDVDNVQPFVFKLPLSNTNAIRSCNEQTIPRVNLNIFNKNQFR